MTSVDYKVDLTINKLSKTIYDQLVSSGSVLSNQIYLVEEEYADLNGQQIRNVAEPTLSSDVATKGYVDEFATKTQEMSGTSITLKNNSVAECDGSSGTVESPLIIDISFEDPRGDELRMCELLINGISTDDAVTVSLPSEGVTLKYHSDAKSTSEGDNHFIFAEYARNKWLISKDIVSEG